MTTGYEAITEDEWKSLATTEITHLTDEEKDYLPSAWDAWLARVRRDAYDEGYEDAQHDAREHRPWRKSVHPYRQEQTQ